MNANPRQLSLAVTAPAKPIPAKKPTRVPQDLINERGGEAWRNASTRRCPTCSQIVLYGLDGDVCALSARVDPTPLTVLGEAVAVISGRGTYNLTRVGGRQRLYLRDADAIEGDRRYPVVPEHRCGAPLHQHAERIAARVTYSIPDTPQF